jgi:quercetin dioxygenase-like cupin family protein
MRGQNVFLMAMAGTLLAASPTEMLRNAHVVVNEFTLKPGETMAAGSRPSVTVYFNDGSLEFRPARGNGVPVNVKRGDAVFRGAESGEIRNTGSGELKFVRTEFLTDGKHEMWKTAGLPPAYRLMIENDYARVYEIRIAAGASEPQHTHRPRVVVCLSGAALKHGLPDGHVENAVLKAGEVGWRAGTTHSGQNVGQTELWTIAIEPK